MDPNLARGCPKPGDPEKATRQSLSAGTVERIYKAAQHLKHGEDGWDYFYVLVVAEVDAAVVAGETRERERCARVAEEHLMHIDVGSEQDHMEPPFRCCVAQAIRARGVDQE